DVPRDGSRSRRRARRRALLGGALFLIAVAALAALAALELRSPRRDVLNARAEVTGVVDNTAGLTSASARADAVAHLDSAHHRLTRAHGALRRSWSLKIVRNVPVVRAYANAVRTLTDNGVAATEVAQKLVVDLDRIARNRPLSGGTVPLDAMGQIAVRFRSSADAIARLDAPPDGLWGQLGRASDEFRRLQAEAPDRLRSGADVLEAGARFLGSGGPRTYFVAGQNNAEMRDQGMVLSYAVLRSSNKGEMSLAKQGRITELSVPSPVDVVIPEGTRAVFSDAPRQLWQNVNITADFSLSGRLMVALYKKATNSGVDGVIALDVPGLAKLLGVLGAVDVPGIREQLTADNARRVLLDELYHGIPAQSADQGARYEKLGDAVTAVVDKMRAGSYDVAAIGVALAEAARGGHFRLFSAHQDEQSVFENRGLSGGPALVAADRTFHVAVQNGTATKLDYFIKPKVEMSVDVDEKGTATVRTNVAVVNGVPADAKPSFQLGPDGAASTRPGQYATRVDLWGPRGSDQPGSVLESGLQLTQQVLQVEAATTENVGFTTVIRNAVRNGELRLRLVPQARAEAMNISVRVVAKGWRIKSSADVNRSWDRTFDLRWRLSR
ncbi:MAG: DUF4012 domain-containing protein, partial [Actinobacteria bacterium]|nr:DUF4012 domain-containing protein [Actinomycetota bacterium]